MYLKKQHLKPTKMKASTKRLLVLISSAFLLLFSFVAFNTTLKSAYANIQVLRGSLQVQQKAQMDKSDAIQYLNTLYGKNKVDIDKISNDLFLAIPDDANTANIMDQVQQICSSNNVVINSVNISKSSIRKTSTSTLVKGLGILQVSLDLVGSYESFKEVLRLMENNIRIMDVGSVGISQADILNRGVFNFGLTVYTYYQAE